MVYWGADRQVRLNAHRPGRRSPSLHLLDRFVDATAINHDQRLQAMRRVTAEFVRIAVVGADEADRLRRIWMADHAAGHDHVHIRALFVHVTQADLGVVVAAALCRKLSAHEGLEVSLGAFTRTGLAQNAWLAAAPSALATAKAEVMAVGLLL